MEVARASGRVLSVAFHDESEMRVPTSEAKMGLRLLTCWVHLLIVSAVLWVAGAAKGRP